MDGARVVANDEVGKARKLAMDSPLVRRLSPLSLNSTATPTQKRKRKGKRNFRGTTRIVPVARLASLSRDIQSNEGNDPV